MESRPLANSWFDLQRTLEIIAWQEFHSNECLACQMKIRNEHCRCSPSLGYAVLQEQLVGAQNHAIAWNAYNKYLTFKPKCLKSSFVS